MIDHLGLQCVDVEASAAFYLRVFAPCGIREAMRIDTPDGPVVGMCGTDGHPQLWVSPAVNTGHRPVHLALLAPSREAVDEVFALAKEVDTEILHEPRVWPEYHPGYYGVFFRDPDGNNVEAVHHSAPPS
jgi:catechol 2,3-dioxygenase-like lactoylglutathione lyase family enzyme